jgi:hypothetical protein
MTTGVAIVYALIQRLGNPYFSGILMTVSSMVADRSRQRFQRGDAVPGVLPPLQGRFPI